MAIVDFGLGNLRSLEHKLRVAGLDVCVVSEPAAVAAAGHLILPGVGHFGPAMQKLTSSGLSSAIREAVRERSVPLLGICLGMQLLTEGSEESGTAGLGLIPGRTLHLRSSTVHELPVPHIGWSKVLWRGKHSSDEATATETFCYFSHSYHVVCGEEHVLATSSYGSDFVSAVIHDKVAGVQFHPEKSHRSGLMRLIDLIIAQRPSEAIE